MSQFDRIDLPAPLDAYFAATDHASTAPLFAADAVVEDEGATHVGLAAIAEWLDRVEAQYHPRYVVQGVETSGAESTVTFQVSGTFPGSPATLRQAIRVEGGLIHGLRTL